MTGFPIGKLPQARPSVSVVIPAYNAAPYIREALESVTAQDGYFSLEIIVVDDGSTDETASVVLGFKKARLIRQHNTGPSAARNRGIREAQSEFVAFLDADDLWTPGTLSALMSVFDAHPQVGMVFGDCRIYTSNGPRPSTLFEAEDLNQAFWGGPAVVQDPYTKLFRVNFVPTGAVLARKQCVVGAGLFDESRRYVEDMDLWFRIALQCAMGYTTHVCELKREHGANVSANWERMTLAFIEVLRNQLSRFPDEIRRRGIRVNQRIAFEYSLMGDKRDRARDPVAARRRYLQAFLASHSVRPVYYWLRTWLPRSG